MEIVEYIVSMGLYMTLAVYIAFRARLRSSLELPAFFFHSC